MAETGDAVSYAELERDANRGAHLFRRLGLNRGDAVALMAENCPEYLPAYWAAQRSGLYIVPISSRLNGSEAAYIINDSGARVFIFSAALPAAIEIARRRRELASRLEAVFCIGRAADLPNWKSEQARMPSSPILDESPGYHMVYSSGTTGQPKGVKRPLPDARVDTASPISVSIVTRYAITGSSIFLSPAPCYHAAPLAYCTAMHRAGATVVIMEHFDPELFLDSIERYGATITQVVPTMFVRLLKLPKETRRRYDLSSLRHAVHGAASCSIPVKYEMLAWWGPIIHEYYGGSEGAGSTIITPQEWLQRPGSVGRAMRGVLHICDEAGEELGPYQTGAVYFEGAALFQYHNDPEQTAAARHPRHETWSTMGDIGHVDGEGYLYLTDRKAFTIIAGGVNIYPQEVENLLVTHDKVADAAVFGVPNHEFGEEVKAIVQPSQWQDAGDTLAVELLTFCRSRLSAFKCPRSVEFERELPRAPTGKLYKKALRDRYWPASDAAKT